MNDIVSSTFPTELQFNTWLTWPELNGEQGIYRERSRQCLLKADTDWEAIEQWLTHQYLPHSTTWRSYQSEAQRLLMWSLVTLRKPISSLEIADYQTYFAFLDCPEPYEFWCMSKEQGRVKRWSHGWRPFRGPLTANSKARAISAINALLSYWLHAGYLCQNPLAMVRLKGPSQVEAIQRLSVLQRAFTQDEWQLIIKALSAMPETNPDERRNKARLRFIIMTLMYAALRRHELVNLTWEHFKKIRGLWHLAVIGKGDKPTLLVLPDAYVDEVIRYRHAYELNDEMPTEFEQGPVIMARFTQNRLSAHRLNSLIKELLNAAAELTSDVAMQRRLHQGSAHWFRHTAATFLDGSGIDPSILKQHMRHSRMETTDVYIHRRVEMVKIQLDKLIVPT